MAWIGRPIRKWPAVMNFPVSASSVEMGTRGLEFSTPSASTSRVYNSSQVIGWGVTIFLSAVFMARTAASHRPPKCGAWGGMCVHLMLWVFVNVSMDCLCFTDPQRAWISWISSRAPTKLVPLSERISCGHPRREMNLDSTARKSSVDSEEHRSKCTALVERQTNTAAYDLDDDRTMCVTFSDLERTSKVDPRPVEGRSRSSSGQR